MELSRYVFALRAWWPLPAALVVLCLLAAFIYNASFTQPQAQATVAVLDPLTARPSGYVQAQVTFDSVVRSQELARRVASKLGVGVDKVEGHLSVALLPSLSAVNESPVYAVRGQASTSAGAIRLTDVATEEARSLYIEVNTPDPVAIQEALKPQIQAAQADYASAKSDYDKFVADNHAEDLPARIAQQRGTVGSLELALLQAQADEAAANATGNTTGYLATVRKAGSLETSLSAEQRKLDALVALEGQYDGLSSRLSLASQHLQQLNGYQDQLLTGQQLPLAAQIKIVDHAQSQSAALVTFLVYALAAIFGALIGLSAVYALALIRHEPQTAADVAEAFGAPVLVRIPRAYP